MNNPSSVVGVIVSLGVGIYFIASRGWISRSAVEWDYSAFGLQIDQKWYEIGSVIGGIGLIALGLLGLAGVIHLSPQL
jgi:hypothetical protein